jgi:hypothetical protein
MHPADGIPVSAFCADTEILLVVQQLPSLLRHVPASDIRRKHGHGMPVRLRLVGMRPRYPADANGNSIRTRLCIREFVDYFFVRHSLHPTFNVPRVDFARNLASDGDILVLFEE